MKLTEKLYHFNPNLNVLENIEKMLYASSPLEMSLLRLQDKFFIYDNFAMMLNHADNRIIEVYAFDSWNAYTTKFEEVFKIIFSGVDLISNRHSVVKMEKLVGYSLPTFNLDQVKRAITEINRILELPTIYKEK